MSTATEKKNAKGKKGEFGEFYDQFGRVINPLTGKPLRDHRNRSHSGKPFHGKEGKPNRKAQKKLDARIKTWQEEQKQAKGLSNYFDRHQPGSLSR